MLASVCGRIRLEYHHPEWKWRIAVRMVAETLKISWSISRQSTATLAQDGVWIWETTTPLDLLTTLWGSSEAMTGTFYKTLSSLAGFVMTMIGVCWAGIIKLTGGHSASHTCCQAKKTLPYKTKTWSVKGEVGPYSQFKIVQIKDMSTGVPGTHAMCLAGIELYGVLSVPYSD